MNINNNLNNNYGSDSEYSWEDCGDHYYDHIFKETSSYQAIDNANHHGINMQSSEGSSLNKPSLLSNCFNLWKNILDFNVDDFPVVQEYFFNIDLSNPNLSDELIEFLNLITREDFPLSLTIKELEWTSKKLPEVGSILYDNLDFSTIELRIAIFLMESLQNHSFYLFEHSLRMLHANTEIDRLNQFLNRKFYTDKGSFLNFIFGLGSFDKLETYTFGHYLLRVYQNLNPFADNIAPEYARLLLGEIVFFNEVPYSFPPKSHAVEPNFTVEPMVVEKEDPIAIEAQLKFEQEERKKTYRLELAKCLTATWFGSTSSHQLLIKLLIESQGKWEFKCQNEKDFCELVTPFINFLTNSQIKDHIIADEILSETLEFFPIRLSDAISEETLANFLGENDLALAQAIYKKIYGIFFSLDHPVSKPLSESLSISSSEGFFELKTKEYLLRSQHYNYFKDKEKIESKRAPCYLIAQDRDQIIVEILQAQFNSSDSLVALSEDEDGLAKRLISPFCEVNPKGFLFSLEQLGKFKEHLAESTNQRILFIEQKKIKQLINTSEKEPILLDEPTKEQKIIKDDTFPKEAPAFKEDKKELKRKYPSSEEWSDLFTEVCQRPKIAKTNSNLSPSASVCQSLSQRKGIQSIPIGGTYHPISITQPTPNLTSMQNPSQLGSVSIPADNSALKINLNTIDGTALALDLKPENFWELTNLQALSEVEERAKKISMRRATLIDCKPINYPIINDLYRAGKIAPCVTFNPNLKSYQIEELSKVLGYGLKGISRILAFEMGLGKTYVYAEYLMQMLLKKRQSCVVLLPKSLLSSIKQDLIEYFDDACAHAWYLRWKKIQDQNSACIQSFLNEFSHQLKKSASHLLPYLKTIHAVASSGNENLLVGAISRNKIFIESVIYFEDLKYGVEAHLKQISAYLKTNDSAKNKIVTSVYNVLSMYLKRLAEKDLDSKRNDAENCLFRAKEIIEFSALKGIRQITSLSSIEEKVAFMGLCGAILEINLHQGIIIDPKLYKDEDLKYLSSISSKKLISIEEAKFEETLKGIGRKEISEKIVLVSYKKAENVAPNQFKNLPLGAIVVDEAQAAHTVGTTFSNWLHNVSKCKAEKTSILLVTGTPFENNFTEMWNLLAIGNHDKFPIEYHNVLMDLIKDVLKHLNSPKDKRDLEKLESSLIKSFGYFENLRKYIICPLTGRHQISDQKIKEAWFNQIPERLDINVDVEMDPSLHALFELIYKENSKNKKNLFKKLISVKKLLFGVEEGSFSLNSQNVINIINAFKTQNQAAIEAYLEKAPTLKTLLNLRELKSLCDDEKGRGIIFTEHRAAAEITQCALKYMFQLSDEQISIIHGDLTTQQRQRVIEWYKDLTAPSKILIMMEKAGGVGFNLPEATKVFQITSNFNPGVGAQAIARVLRVGNVGVKEIYLFNHGLSMEDHYRAVQTKKIEWSNFFWGSSTNNNRNQFELWCKVMLAESYNILVNKSRTLQKAQEEYKEILELFEEVKNHIHDADLKEIVGRLAPPKPMAPVTSPVQPKGVTIPVQPKDATSGAKILLANEWIVFPFNAATEKEAFLADRAIKQMDRKILKKAIQELREHKELREVARRGLKELKEHKLAPQTPCIVSIFEEISKLSIEKEVNLSYEVYEFLEKNGKSNFYHNPAMSNRQENPPARLYKSSNRPGFELLLHFK